ncbi:hypothetical protein T440DRAFT_467871 [Plenodomus tracheiphilus IPT5]|uniref:Peptidase S54 rhomboid domain-containing protein n=1 Tax=Plenodomus tracheiphilus IPT5 TaxID=1408161 RepID=A0A6A7B6E7_9PLEO|nr:hypothetical protein T440DRAFT_467871 [Plenodomus tracheiphilus IPT5]
MSALLRLTRPLRSLPTKSNSLPQTFFSRIPTPSRTRLQSRSYSYASHVSNTRTNMAILYTFIGANLSVYGYAMYLKSAAMQGHVAPFSKFIQNMTLNLEDFRAGRWWTTVTATFTHLSIGHIFGNMCTVFFLGRFLATARIITPARYFIIAMGSGLCGSIGYLVNRYVQTQKTGERDNTRGLGFSGAVTGISSVAACLAPTAKVRLYGIVPVPLWGLVAGYAAYDGFYLNDSNSRIGHAGHLGGLGFGLVYYFFKLRGLRV